MRMLFVHDHKFCRGEDGCYYSDGQFPYGLWQRYLEVFDEIVVAGRVRPLRPGESLEKFDVSSGPRVSFVEVPSVSGPLAAFTARREAAARLTAALQRCDALVVRVASELSRVAYPIAEGLHKPWAVEVVGCTFDSLWNYGNWQGRLYAPYAAYMTRKMIKRAPFALYVTKEFLQKRYPCPGITLGCSDVQLIPRDEAVLEQRLTTIKARRRPLAIGLIGSLVQNQKGIDTALAALGNLKDKLPPFRFYVLGGGDPRRWEDMAARYGVAAETVFCGILPSGAAVNQWLDQLDLYIQPSFVEGLPRALVEAMSRGCPALGSRVGGIPELLDEACLHRPGDSGSLAAMIAAAVTDPCWQIQQATRNFRVAEQYDKVVLDQIRRGFWQDFAKFCEQWKS